MSFLFRQVLKEDLSYCYNQLMSYILVGIGNLKKKLWQSIHLSEEGSNRKGPGR